VQVDQRVPPGPCGPSDQGHVGLFWCATSFLGIAADACADHIFPDGLSSHAPRYHVVYGQLLGREPPAAVLAAVLVPGKDVAPVELDLVGRQTVIEEQPDDLRDSDIKVHGCDPVIAVWFELSLELTYLAPALEIVVGVGPVLFGDHLCQLPKQ